MAQALRVGLIGAGVFARYHAGKIAASKETVFIGIYDLDAHQACALAAKHQTRFFTAADALISACEAVIIATPARTHFSLTHKVLSAGRHALVEKPLALAGEDARNLAELAVEAKLVLQVGHQERMVCRALGLFANEAPICAIDLIRKGPPPKTGRAMDVSVIWDLMIHDIDLALCLLGRDVRSLSCRGHARLGPELDQAQACLKIGDSDVRLQASRIADKAERTMRLTYETGSIEIDFLERTLRNTTASSFPAQFDHLVPDPLGAADALFFRACLYGDPPMITGLEAARAVELAARLETLAQAGAGPE